MASLSVPTTCAACGKEGGDELKACTACKLVKYCNRDCQISHRSKHKKECKKRVAELHDEALFEEPPPPEECPICFLTLPILYKSSLFKSCCGKIICCGCIYAMKKNEGVELCPFCRSPSVIREKEDVERVKKLMDSGNAEAFFAYGNFYSSGSRGLPRDWAKASEMWLKAGELGCAVAYNNLGFLYEDGRGVDIDKKKAKHYYELAAISGDIKARFNLGCIEGKAANHSRAMKHMLIAARAGGTEALDRVKLGFQLGLVTKDEYASTLRAFHERQKEMKSAARDKAAESEDYFAKETRITSASPH